MNQTELDDTARAYRLFVSSPEGQMVLRDLAGFCKFRWDITDPVDEGKRRVFLHILEYSQLTDEQLLALYAGRMIPLTTEPQDE